MINEKLLNKASDITMTDYSGIDNMRDLAETIIGDLLYEIEHQNELITEIKQYIEDNYKQTPYEEMI